MNRAPAPSEPKPTMASMRTRSFFLSLLLALLATSNTSQVQAQQQCDAIQLLGDLSTFDGLQIAIHRSGEVEPCGGLLTVTTELLVQALSIQGLCDMTEIDKYDVDALLTTYFLQNLGEKQCGPVADLNEESSHTLADFCDRGPSATPVQPDHARLKAVGEGRTLPCRYYTREGRVVRSFDTLASLAHKTKQGAAASCEADNQGKEQEGTCSAGPILHLTAIPAGRVFMLAPSFVGEKFLVDFVPDWDPIEIEVLSVEPRIFELHGFFTPDEANTLIELALTETSESHRLKRSTTGAVNGSVYDKRTSENAWLTENDEAVVIMRRIQATLGFDEYYDSHSDGLQLLRYQNGQAYTSHHDYLDRTDKDDYYDYDTTGVGGNRFATVLLYLADMGENDGGETLFDEAWPPGTTQEQIRDWSMRDAVAQLRESGVDVNKVIKPGSWEERMVAMCRSRLAIQAKAGRAVLFYSQRADGTEDKSVMHGACPVLNGTKWAANLWVWSAPMSDYPLAPEVAGKPVTEEEEEEEEEEEDEDEDAFEDDDDMAEDDDEDEEPAVSRALQAQFQYTGEDPQFDGAELVYAEDDSSFGKISSAEPINVNTFEGHKWSIKKDGKVLKTIVIGKLQHQVFKL